jgi:hypothetical protein
LAQLISSKSKEKIGVERADTLQEAKSMLRQYLDRFELLALSVMDAAKVFWDTPNDGGSDIHHYYVQIKAKDLSWRDVIGCGSDNVCVVPFSQLR